MRYKFLRFPGGKPKAVTLSYDDAVVHDLRFSDTITQYGLKCTFNINSDVNKWIRDEQIEEYMLSRGHEIAIHGANHRALGTQSTAVGIREVLDCKRSLEQRFGRIIRGMAYPDTGITFIANNTSYDKIKQYLNDLGVVYSRSLGSDNFSFQIPNDWYNWMPSVHHSNPNVMEYVDKFLSYEFNDKVYYARFEPKLFYMWGHSYEFENNDNWNLLDEICEKIAHRDDIWYATNIEIYDYVNAYYSLIWNTDETMVYNPTLFEIWFSVDKVIYSIKPGETLKF